MATEYRIEREPYGRQYWRVVRFVDSRGPYPASRGFSTMAGAFAMMAAQKLTDGATNQGGRQT